VYQRQGESMIWVGRREVRGDLYICQHWSCLIFKN